jgi:hypothetical protein
MRTGIRLSHYIVELISRAVCFAQQIRHRGAGFRYGSVPPNLSLGVRTSTGIVQYP